MPYKFSPSSLSLLKDCPRCFWLSFHGVKRPETIFPSLPGGMDRILKVHFDRFMEKGELPPELRHLDCMKGCSLFDDREKLSLWRNNLKGVSWTDSAGNILRGAVDNILNTVSMHGAQPTVTSRKRLEERVCLFSSDFTNDNVVRSVSKTHFHKFKDGDRC
jgi:hypothetical protein